MVKVKKKNIEKWVYALRSGKYKQTKHRLQDKDGYCCLGVACKLFIPKHKQLINDSRFLIGVLPEDQESPSWLIDIAYDFYVKTGISLIDLNDTKQYSFNEIADLLELVYIHKALD